MRDVELARKDKLTFGWVICIQKDNVTYGFLGKNLALFEDAENAIRYHAKSDANSDLPKTLSQAMVYLAEANGTSILDELSEVPVKDLLELFQVKELRVAI